MTGLFALLCIFSLFGLIDIAYFHLWRYQLFNRPSSRSEQMTHVIRLALFVAVLAWVMFVRAEGRFALILPALILADLANSAADVLLEPKSRADLGGLPPGEYFIHMAAMFTNGAIAAVAAAVSWNAFHRPSSLQWHPLEIPVIFLAIGAQILAGTFLLLLFEAWGTWRAWAKPR